MRDEIACASTVNVTTGLRETALQSKYLMYHEHSGVHHWQHHLISSHLASCHSSHLITCRITAHVADSATYLAHITSRITWHVTSKQSPLFLFRRRGFFSFSIHRLRHCAHFDTSPTGAFGSNGFHGESDWLFETELGLLRSHWIIGPPFMDLKSLVTISNSGDVGGWRKW